MATSTDINKLSNLINVDRRYSKSTNIILDQDNTNQIPNYIFTPTSSDYLGNILQSINNQNNKNRSWSILGPYGSGKSTFALLVSLLMSNSQNKWVQESINTINTEHVKNIVNEYTSSPKNYIVINLEGSQSNLTVTLFQSIKESFIKCFPKKITINLFNKINEINNLELNKEGADSNLIMKTIKESLDLIENSDYSGLSIIIDEFGRFLEFGGDKNITPNLQIIQQLAEIARSRNNADLLLFVIAHQAFSDYAPITGGELAREFGKVQGRFEPIDFIQNPDYLYPLIKNSWDIDNQLKQTLQNHNFYIENYNQILSTIGFESNNIKKLNQDYYPLHPLSLYALPRLSSKLGQNERSMYSFISSAEPAGLTWYLRTTEYKKSNPAILTVDYLFDYFIGNIRLAAIERESLQLISKVKNSLIRVESSNLIEQRIVKIIGILEIASSNLPILTEINSIYFALNDKNISLEKLKEILDSLVNRKILRFKNYSNCYVTWEGTDFNFDKAITESSEKIINNFNQTSTIINVLEPRPLYARQHSAKTNIDRIFSVNYLLAKDFLNTEKVEFNPETSDGEIIYIFPDNLEEKQDCIKKVSEEKNKRFVYAITNPMNNLFTHLIELKALKDINKNYPHISEDNVALVEKSDRIQAKEEYIFETISHITDFENADIDWINDGTKLSVKSIRDLQQIISKICDNLFPKSPIINSELINRETLSSAISAAVKNIIDSLLEYDPYDLPYNLNFTGNGPNVSILKSFYYDTGLITSNIEKKWQFSTPVKGNLKDAWEKIIKTLQSSSNKSVNLNKLLLELKESPYGIRKSTANLLIWSAIIAERSNICIYENNTYQPKITRLLFDRYLYNPSSITLRWLSAKGIDANLILKLNTSIPNANLISNKDKSISIQSFLNNLYKWYATLPPYIVNTKSKSEESCEFISHLEKQHEPIDLIFKYIPESLNTTKTNISEFSNKFESVIYEIDRSYESLLKKCIKYISDKFSIENKAQAIRDHFEDINPKIIELLSHEYKAVFLSASSSLNIQQWLEATCTMIHGSSPKNWTDNDYIEFCGKVSLISTKTKELTKIYYSDPDLLSKENIFKLSFGKIKNEPLVEEYIDENNINSSIYLDELKEKISNLPKDKQIQTIIALLKSLTYDNR